MLTPAEGQDIVASGHKTRRSNRLTRDEMMRKFEEGATMQVATIVRDLDTAMQRHWDVFKIGPWDIWDFNPGTVMDYVYRGKPANHSCLIACAWSGRHPARADPAGKRLLDL